jgi:hypothetical protein
MTYKLFEPHKYKSQGHYVLGREIELTIVRTSLMGMYIATQC